MGRRAATLGIAVTLVAVVALLGAARWAHGGAEDASATAATASYTVRLGLERGLTLGEQEAVIEVRDQHDRPVAAEQVSLTPVMIEMGHLLPTLPAAPAGDPGNYRAHGEVFSMTGEWDVDVRVRTVEGTETARFSFELG